MSKLYTLASGQVSGVVNATNTISTIGDSGVNSSPGLFDTLEVLINVTAGGTATGTVALYIQDSFDGGTTWDDVVSSNTFALGAAAVNQRFFVQGKIATTATQGSPTASETLTAGTVRNGPFGDRFRLREKVSAVAGSPVGCTYSVSIVAK
jgi:hypothetical protein